MTTLKAAADEFLAHHRIAVAGVSRDEKQTANFLYRRLRDRGYDVFAVNPNADEVEGDHCYHDVGAIPGGVDGVLVVTPPQAGEQVVRDCVRAGIERVWLHGGAGPTSVSEEAVAYGRAHGVRVIPGGCPAMYDGAADPGHRCLRALMRATRRIPKEIPA